MKHGERKAVRGADLREAMAKAASDMKVPPEKAAELATRTMMTLRANTLDKLIEAGPLPVDVQETIAAGSRGDSNTLLKVAELARASETPGPVSIQIANVANPQALSVRGPDGSPALKTVINGEHYLLVPCEPFQLAEGIEAWRPLKQLPP